MDLQNSSHQNARRKVLQSAVCAVCHENGFGFAERAAVETLVEILQSLLFEIGRSGHAFCELSGRTQPLVGDVAIALIEMGIDVESISAYAKRVNRICIAKPSQAPKQVTPKILQAGDKKPFFSYIPDYFPPFPDSHSYIRTPTYKQPVTEYEAIREKSASQKRDVERALTRFMAKTCENSLTHSLFPDEQMSHLFPLISLKINSNSLFEAMTPKDQVFEEDEEEETKDKKSSKFGTNLQSETSKDSENVKVPECTASDTEIPDNPYLRLTKMCKKCKK
ncbi:transcription initiation factor TFIID subunit 8-like isoform X2 [Leptotrombidium deliense]|uniref:Transcription initiation factor TFIID subunit 8 n=1 Tax=Leptotrombidium deliense TaxID=299467 RepID=A0A443SAD8_9ACAR|nr:transcription initiation factor TFIID subunit 8-like isoform X2 [Leptotrombidium deliense]